MPGTIQSIERAAAMLRLLGSAGRPLALAEVAAPLDLPRPTAHGILRTLREVGFVDQDRDTGRYTLAAGLRRLGERMGPPRPALPGDELGRLAGGERGAGGPARACRPGAAVELVHHVFRPDGSPQRLRTGEQLPLHATAVGKCLLAFAPIAVPRPHELDLQRYTGRTVVAVGTLTEQLATARHRGWAAELGEHRTGVGGLAAPRAHGRWARGRRAGRRGAGGGAVRRRRHAGAAPGRAAAQRGAGDLGAGWGRRGDRAGGRGDRPGHHLDPVPAVQPGRPDGRRRPARAPPALPAVGLGRARRRGDLAQRHPHRPRRAAQRRAGAGEHRRAGHREPARDDASSGTGTPGTPLARAITWQDTRTDGIVARLVDDGSAALVTRAVRAAAGHLLRRPPAALAARPRPGRASRRRGRRRAVRHDGELAGVAADRRSGRRTHITDVTNASRTMLMDLRTRAVGTRSC